MMQAFVESVKGDLIARRASRSAVMILFRLYTAYQPGGAGERSVVLQQLQGIDPPSDFECLLEGLETLAALATEMQGSQHGNSRWLSLFPGD